MGTHSYGKAFRGKIHTESGDLSLRNGPGTDYSKVGTLSRGQKYWFISQYGETAFNGWLVCDANGDSSYTDGMAAAQYVAWDGTNSDSNGNIIGTIRLTSGYLNLRKTPSTAATSIGKLYNGDEVLYLNFDNQNVASGWAHVATTTGTGWVAKQYLDLVG